MTDQYVYAKFQATDILVEQGRLFYAVVYAFVISGYRVQIYDNLYMDRLGRCGKLVLDLPGVELTKAVPAQPESSIYLYDKQDRTLIRHNWRKKIRLRDDLFSNYCFGSPLVMPYAMHPRQTLISTKERLIQLRAKTREMRIFFSGDTKNYGWSRIRYPSPKLPRLTVINTLMQRMNAETVVVRDAAARDLLLQTKAEYLNRCVIIDTSHIWVEESVWLDTLATADFFLSPPGVTMPMCHNIIEAMAVGTIPITNYPEWMHPNLVHMENCIVFTDSNDLISKMQLALSLDEQIITEMRENVIHYYTEYLDPQRFVNRLDSKQDFDHTILLYTEKNVRENWAKLNAHSVLMWPTMKQEKQNRLQCLFGEIVSRMRHIRSKGGVWRFLTKRQSTTQPPPISTGR